MYLCIWHVYDIFIFISLRFSILFIFFFSISDLGFFSFFFSFFFDTSNSSVYFSFISIFILFLRNRNQTFHLIITNVIYQFLSPPHIFKSHTSSYDNCMKRRPGPAQPKKSLNKRLGIFESIFYDNSRRVFKLSKLFFSSKVYVQTVLCAHIESDSIGVMFIYVRMRGTRG